MNHSLSMRQRTWPVIFLCGGLASPLATFAGVSNASPAASGASIPNILVFSKSENNLVDRETIKHAVVILREIGAAQKWNIDATEDSSTFTNKALAKYDAVVWNNTRGDVLNDSEQVAFQEFIHNGGGYAGIHMAIPGATESGWPWYEELVGARFKQLASGTPTGTLSAGGLFVSADHPAIANLPSRWLHPDAWLEWAEDPFLKPNTDIWKTKGTYPLLFLSERASNIRSDNTWGGRTVSWAREFEGGRVFYTALGHTTESFDDDNFRRHLAGGIEWAMGHSANLAVRSREVAERGLVVDLNADKGLTLEDKNRVGAWRNQVPGSKVLDFVKRDEGRPPKYFLLPPENPQGPGSGRPVLRRSLAALNGHNSLSFREQELVNFDEDTLDGLLTGQGFTWLVVLAPYAQIGMGENVNGFIGYLEPKPLGPGFWAGLSDDNSIWAGARNGITPGKIDANNPVIRGPKLERGQYYIIASRLGAGRGAVLLELFVDSATPVASTPFPINPAANASRLTVGQDRDAPEHPGFESFDGEIARVLVYDTPLSDTELANTIDALKLIYFSGPPQ